MSLSVCLCFVVSVYSVFLCLSGRVSLGCLSCWIGVESVSGVFVWLGLESVFEVLSQWSACFRALLSPLSNSLDGEG